MKLLKHSLLPLLLIIVSFCHAQTVDEIVDKHVAAIGGKDAWKKVNTIIQQATVKVQGADVDVVTTLVNGKGMRQNISVMGMTGFQIMTPVAGWNFFPFQGQTKPEAATPEDVKENIDELDTQGSLIDYKEKGHTLEYLGKDDVDGTEAYKLKITHKNGKVQTLFIDPSTYYLIRVVSKQKANGQEVEVTTNFNDYRKLPEGIVMPMSLQLPFGQMKVSKVEINKVVDENIFKPDTK